MARAILTACLLAAFAPLALADRLVLVDGRSFTGIVTVESDTVKIDMPYGSLRFNKDEVSSIDLKETPESEYAKKLQATPTDNPKALLELAQWASRNGLPRQAEEIYSRVVKLQPDNAAARQGLGFLKLDGEWRTFDQCVELCHNKLQAGQQQALLTDVLPQLEAIASTRDRMLALRDVVAQAQLRAGKFAAATKTYEELAEKSASAAAVYYATIVEILKENADGMYVLGEPYPPTSELLSGEPPALKPGPVSLSEPLALKAAIRDRARKEIESARKFLDEAGRLEQADADAARSRYSQAGKNLDRADAMAPGISRSYRIEIARRRIAAARRNSAADAAEFDKEMATLGKKGMTPPAYRDKMLRLIALLDNLRDDLKEIQALAKPYAKDLILELKWAELDLKNADEMRQVLAGELDGRK